MSFEKMEFQCDQEGSLTTVFTKKNGQAVRYPYQTEHMLYKTPDYPKSIPLIDQCCPFCKGHIHFTSNNATHCLSLRCPGSYESTIAHQCLVLQMSPVLLQEICQRASKSPMSDLISIVRDLPRGHKKQAMTHLNGLSGTDFLSFMRLPKVVIEDLTNQHQPLLQSPEDAVRTVRAGQFSLAKLDRENSFGCALTSFGLVNREYIDQYLAFIGSRV